jgi:hypothetical protein
MSPGHALEDRGLARAGRADHVQNRQLFMGEQRAVLARDQIVRSVDI